MSEAEMHSLELAALEDPFLADAIEGFQKNNYNSPVTGTDLEDLHHRLKTRIEQHGEKKLLPLYLRRYWKVAAMLVLVAGAVTFLYYQGYKDPLHESMAVTRYKSEEVQPPAADNTKTAPAPSANQGLPAGTENKLPQPENRISRKPAPGTYRNKPAVISQGPLASSSSTMSAPPANIQADTLMALNRATDVKAATTITPGIATRSSPVRFYETNQKTKADTNTTFIDVQDAIPVTGLQAFYQYIELNKKLPPDSLNLHGEVIVSFIVNENGSLSNFKIEQAISKLTDDEAIRLIKEGPAWKLLRNRKAKAVIRIKF
jgi:hypothetical protein